MKKNMFLKVAAVLTMITLALVITAGNDQGHPLRRTRHRAGRHHRRDHHDHRWRQLQHPRWRNG